MAKIKQEISNIFTERKHLTLGVKLVTTFAITYYSLFFLFLTILGIFYESIFDPYYSDPLINGQKGYVFYLFVFLWLNVGMIVVSLILLFRKNRYAKLLFMIFTIVLIVYQLVTTSNYVWISYILELIMLIVIAPLKVVSSINLKVKEKKKPKV